MQFRLKTPYIEADVLTKFTRYAVDNSLALLLLMDDTEFNMDNAEGSGYGEIMARPSVYIEREMAPDIPRKPNGLWIKSYAENTGMLEALTQAGVVESGSIPALTVTYPTHTVTFHYCTLTPKATAEASEAVAIDLDPSLGKQL